MDGKLLLVIPTVLVKSPDGFLLDEHFGNNLRAYLASFEHVTIACPATLGGGSEKVLLSTIAGWERCSIVVLPEPYREDRYLRHRRAVGRQLRGLIATADYLLVSPHAPLEWSTLATRIALAMGRDYNMESDWNLQNVLGAEVKAMPRGLNRLRKSLNLAVHSRVYLDSMRRARLSLLQGAAVFDAYKDVAPNPQKVLNVQVTAADRIPDDQFAAKLARVRSGAPLRIVYAGRAAAMKGPQDWQQCLQQALGRGLNATATWFGDGELRGLLERSADALGIAAAVAYPGNVPRETAFAALREAEIFLFCHLTDESPRCLTEALAAATPLVGYASLFSSDLVAERGGGELVPLGDWQALANRLLDLDRDRDRLASLIEAARDSSRLYDREDAIATRIRLMREQLRRPQRVI